MEYIFIPFVLIIWYVINRAIREEKGNANVRRFNEMLRRVQESAEDSYKMDQINKK